MKIIYQPRKISYGVYVFVLHECFNSHEFLKKSFIAHNLIEK